jgi:hypothetical protein
MYSQAPREGDQHHVSPSLRAAQQLGGSDDTTAMVVRVSDFAR